MGDPTGHHAQGPRAVTDRAPGAASGPPPARAHAASLGIVVGTIPAGPTDSIHDVPGVRLGHATVWHDDPAAARGPAAVRTGVSVVLPCPPDELWQRPMAAGVSILNGAGELTGSLTVNEWGTMETPIFLCSSMAVGRVYDGAVSAISEVAQGAGWDEPLMPIVGECDDSFLSTPLPVQVTEHEVRAALADAASSQRSGGDARPAEGVVGAGTGMHGFRYKGGIGTASRVVAPRDRRHRFDAAAPDDGPPYTIGVVALVNFGLPDRLSIAGVPVGRILQAEGWPLRADTVPSPRAHADAAERDTGSCIVVIATDAPLTSRQLQRLAHRGELGLGRTGSAAGHGSGEILIAFSTTSRVSRHPDAPGADADRIGLLGGVHPESIDPIFAAAVDATEQAVVNCLVAADTVVGRDGRVLPGLPLGPTLEILGNHHALRPASR